MKLETCIIIVNMNGENLLKDCLDSIKKNMPVKSKVIVVDNNSSDGSKKILKEKYKWVDIVENKSNRGFSGANNDGIEYAYKKYDPDYYYFLNNDTKVTKGFISKLIEIKKKVDNVGLLGSNQKNFLGKNSISSGNIGFFWVKYYFGKESQKVGWVSGAAFMVPREVIEDVGGFDEVYNPIYYEESDWEERIKKKGYGVYTVPLSIIYHKGGASKKNYPFNPLKIFYKNRIRFFMKYKFFSFFPRFFVDIFRGIKGHNIGLLFSGYLQGIKSLKEEKILKVVN